MQMSHTVLFSVIVLLMVSSAVWGQSEPDQEQTDTTAQETETDTQQMVQMPLAVDKAAEAGAPQVALDRMTEAMLEGDTGPETFNETVGTTLNEGGVPGITNVGSFVNQKVEEGLRGEALSAAIHEHLNAEYGIPAGPDGNETEPTSPVTDHFISQETRDRIRQQRQQGLKNQPELGGKLGANDRTNPNRRSSDQAASSGRIGPSAQPGGPSSAAGSNAPAPGNRGGGPPVNPGPRGGASGNARGGR